MAILLLAAKKHGADLAFLLLTSALLAERHYCLPKIFGSLAAMERDEKLVRFGALVRSRREELGIQQDEMRRYNGPSSTTLSGVERGMVHPSPLTLRRLDVGLRWEKGSAKAALAGGEPTPLGPASSPEEFDEPERPGPTAMESIFETMHRLNDLMTEAIDNEDWALLQVVTAASAGFSGLINDRYRKEYEDGLETATEPDASPEGGQAQEVKLDETEPAPEAPIGDYMGTEVVGEPPSEDGTDESGKRHQL